MTRRKRRNHSSAFKAKVALAAVKGDHTLVELVEQFDIHPNQIQDWKKRLVEGAEDVFGGERRAGPAPGKGGREAPRQDWSTGDGERFFIQSARARPMSERRAQIQIAHGLPKTRRCELLNVARSTAYYRPGRVSQADLELMRRIDEIHLQWPFHGSRRIRDELQARGHPV